MRRIKKAALSLSLTFGLALTVCLGAYAAEAIVVVGLNMSEDGAVLFLRGELSGGLSAKVSGQECEIEIAALTEQEAKARTLFLIDISTSMRQGSQKQVLDMLTGLIEGKVRDEQYAIAAFGEEYNLIADFTGDRYDLAKAVERLEWNGRASGIYSAVDEALRAIRDNPPDEWMFTQIVVFSDGVEKAGNGIIKEELFFSLKESPLPVHTVGFQYENNADGLKELYAISRVTGGFNYELAANAEVVEAADQIATYIAGVSRARVRLPERVKDGAVRPLELFDSSGARILQYDLHMPLSAQVPSAPAPPAPPEPVPGPETAKEPEPPARLAISIPVIVLAGVGFAALAAISIFMVNVAKQKKTSRPEAGSGEKPSNLTEFVAADGDATMFLIAEANKKNGGGHYLILNDLAQPHKRFGALVTGKVEIGRDPNQPGIVIDYDKKISRHHFAVVKRDGGLWIEDLGSANKTYVNDEIITLPKLIHDNDVISCGRT
ncbi:MAG: FHA domain-containing protein, partial [Peptococcaceae bacterium]|nr:FHA domain-containing protein [Peptococcaceae bacterium]